MEPGVEAVGIAQARKVAPGPQVGVLDRIARELLIAEDQAADRFQVGDGRDDQQPEGVLVAPARSLHEIALIHGLLDVIRPDGRIQPY